MAAPIKSTTIEFHRLGVEEDSLTKGKPYIRTSGFQKPAQQITSTVGLRDIVIHQERLRYKPARQAADEAAAKVALCEMARSFLDPAMSDAVAAGPKTLHQVDIVTHAAELRAFPFEAVYADETRCPLDLPGEGIVLTRRIRGEFSDEVPPWPVKPALLFVHAEICHDFTQELVQQHRDALADALQPWADATQVEHKGLLKVCEVRSLQDLRELLRGASFAYVHILAHGIKVPNDDLPQDLQEWGLRLGEDSSTAASPRSLAEVLAPRDGYPLVVTLAACDGGTNSSPSLGNESLAEALHRSGVPVVVASQFPLTFPGSVTLASRFYGPLLSGGDVRQALHAARVALRQEARQKGDRIHDWLSLVGYVRLPPEGYSTYLREFGLRVQLGLLEAARSKALPLFEPEAAGGALFGEVEKLLDLRLQALEGVLDSLTAPQHRELHGECAGLRATTGKSLAELRFLQSRQCPADRESLLAASHEALEVAMKRYGESYRRDVTQHWQGIQKLSLEVVLTGRCADPVDLLLVRRAAETAMADDGTNYWACGTLAEVILLEGAATGQPDLAAARRVLDMLVDRAADDKKDGGYAALSTGRQLARYVTWWTKGNGFFPGEAPDLSGPAAELWAYLRAQQQAKQQAQQVQAPAT